MLMFIFAQVINTSDGLDLLEWGFIAGAITAIIICVRMIYLNGIKPVVKASKAFNQRWDDAGEIMDIKLALEDIVKAITPSNGDDRTLSDRLDDIKHMAADAKNVAQETKDEFLRYQRDELLERRERTRLYDDDKRTVNVRLANVEKSQGDMAIRQTWISQRMSNMEQILMRMAHKLELDVEIRDVPDPKNEVPGG